jgi:hypothetical protein
VEGSVDVPAFLSECGSSSYVTVCISVSTVGVAVVWVLESTVQVSIVWVLVSTRLAISASLSISVSILPTSRPSSNPSSYPLSRAAVISCCTSLWLYVNSDVSTCAASVVSFVGVARDSILFAAMAVVVVVEILVVAFCGHRAPKANENSFHVLFSCVPKFSHHWSASEPDFKCILNASNFSLSVMLVL